MAMTSMDDVSMSRANWRIAFGNHKRLRGHFDTVAAAVVTSVEIKLELGEMHRQHHHPQLRETCLSNDPETRSQCSTGGVYGDGRRPG